MNELGNLVSQYNELEVKIKNFKGRKAKVFFIDEYTIGTIDLIDIKNNRVYIILDEIYNEYGYQQVNGHPWVDYNFEDIKKIY